MPRVSLIAALAENRTIGRNNQLPWKLPRDLGRFKALTLGKPVIMGRLTFESLGRPLPGRLNIVLTHRRDYAPPGCSTAHTPQAALDLCGDAPEVMVIGGGEVYRRFMPLADRQYLTLVHERFEGDAHYPDFAASEWEEIGREPWPADDRHPYACTFVTLERSRQGVSQSPGAWHDHHPQAGQSPGDPSENR